MSAQSDPLASSPNDSNHRGRMRGSLFWDGPASGLHRDAGNTSSEQTGAERVRPSDVAGMVHVPGDPGVGGMDLPAQNRRDSSDERIFAVTAASHYPGIMHDEMDLRAVPEMVNTAMDREEGARRQAARPTSSSPPAELYMSDSEMTDALGDLSEIDPPAGRGDVDMETIVHRLIRNTPLGHNVSTIPPDSDDEEGNNLILDYESIVLRDMSTPSTPRDDDPDDTRKFYLDDDEDDLTDWARNYGNGSRLTEVDFDDFYRDFDCESQMPETAAPVAEDGQPAEDGNLSSDNEDAAGLDMAGNTHFPPSSVHGTSKHTA